MLENCVTQNEKKTKYSQSLKNRGNEKGDHLQTPLAASQDLFTNPYPTPGPTAPVQLATVTQQSLQISTKHHQCIAMQLRVAQTTRPTHATLTVQCIAMFSDTLRCIFKQCFYTLLKIVCFMYLKAILGYILG